jgi:hypothetical protein
MGLAEVPSDFGAMWQNIINRGPTRPLFLFGAWVLVLTTSIGAAQSAGVVKVSATSRELRLTLAEGPSSIAIFEQAPGQKLTEPGTALNKTPNAHQLLTIPRFDGARDRLYSAFGAFDSDKALIGQARFVSEFENVSKYSETFPSASSKKGLQVQMVEDAIALGVKHAALNVNLATLVDLKHSTNSYVWEMDGQKYHFKRRSVDGIPVKQLNNAGMVVTFILLNYANPDPIITRVMTHPSYDSASSGKISAFNLTNPESLGWYKAALEFLGDRFSRLDTPNGRVANYIVGNEVNSHFEWYNMGKVPLETIVENYEQAVRVANTAIRKFSPSSRVYLSLEHHWNMAYTKDPLKHCQGKRFIDYFNEVATRHGNYDWNLAHHPYPENLFEPRTWRDKTALPASDSPRITFKNLEQLTTYFRRSELLYHGQPRHIILSEQGFHSTAKPEGELWQAAGFCYAWEKVDQLPGIDAFILHRHVDHKMEGGLNLGLWTRKPDSVATPDRKKKIYEVFRLADTPEWEKAFEFAKPVIGITNWHQVITSQGSTK